MTSSTAIRPVRIRQRVVVIGGGYAGTAAANRLRKRDDIDITLINPRPEFVQRIRLHQLVADSGTATADFGRLLGEGIHLVVDRATHIDRVERRVELASGDVVGYDYLIYAAGSMAALPQDVPGVAEFGYRIAEYEHALRLRSAVRASSADAGIVVVGGGLTAIETAAELAGSGRKVALVCGNPHLPSLGDRARTVAVRELELLGVDIRQGVSVTAVGADRVKVSDGSSIPSRVTIWAAGFGIPDLAVRSGLSTDPAGRLITDETLTSIDDPRIVAAGDASAPAGTPLRMSCQAAGPLGLQAAETVVARIAGTEPAAVDLGFVATCVSLGRKHGVIQTAHADDSPRKSYVSGRLGAMIKEAVCRSTVASLRLEARRPGIVPWSRGVKIESPVAVEM